MRRLTLSASACALNAAARVGCLAGEHERAFVGLDQQRLVAGSVAGRRDDAHARQEFVFAVNRLQAGIGKVERVFGQGEVDLAGGFELRLLNVDGNAGEFVVAARVVPVHVAVDDDVDVGRIDADVEERLAHRPPMGLVVVAHRVEDGRHAGIEQHVSLDVADHETGHEQWLTLFRHGSGWMT